MYIVYNPSIHSGLKMLVFDLNKYISTDVVVYLNTPAGTVV